MKLQHLHHPLVALAVLFSAGPPSPARAAAWRPIGPDGGALSAVAEAPNGRTLYLSSLTAGMFKSGDGGRSWRRLPVSLPGPGPLAVDAVSSALLYVGTSSGLYRTADGGTTWEHVETRLPELATAPVRALLADPHRPGVAWAAFAPPRRLLQTTDGGATWKARDHGLGRRTVRALTAHPFLAGHLYAATDDGIWASRDGGASWLRLGLRGKGTVNVAVDAGTEEVVHALAVEAINHYGITTDRLYVLSRATHGSFVRDIGDDGPGNGIYTRVASDPLTPGRTYAATSSGTFVQTAPGGAWQRLPAGQSLPAATVLPSRVRPDSLFRLEALVDGGGLFVSRDGGASWMHSDHGLNAGQLLQIEPDPTDPRRLYAVPTCCQLRRSEDGGTSWETVGSDIPHVGLGPVLTDPGHPGTAYLATADSAWKTEDGGDHWRRLGIDPNVLALDPGGAGRPETLYGNDRFRLQLHRSRDGVASWEDLGDTGFSTSVLALSQGTTPPLLYANGYAPAPHSHHTYRDRLRRSTDDGTTWTTLLVPGRGDTIFTAIADVDAAGRRIYAAFLEADGNFRATSGGIFRSTDGGTTWTSLDVAAARPPVDTIAVDPHDSAHLFAGTPGGGIYESRDAGATWTSIADGLPSADVTHLTLDPNDPRRLFVSLLGGGAYLREEDE